MASHISFSTVITFSAWNRGILIHATSSSFTYLTHTLPSCVCIISLGALYRRCGGCCGTSVTQRTVFTFTTNIKSIFTYTARCWWGTICTPVTSRTRRATYVSNSTIIATLAGCWQWRWYFTAISLRTDTTWSTFRTVRIITKWTLLWQFSAISAIIPSWAWLKMRKGNITLLQSESRKWNDSDVHCYLLESAKQNAHTLADVVLNICICGVSGIKWDVIWSNKVACKSTFWGRLFPNLELSDMNFMYAVDMNLICTAAHQKVLHKMPIPLHM